MRVFIAGPYTHGDVAANVRDAMVTGLQVLRAGHHPYVPHLCHFMHMQSPQPYKTWTDLDNEFLRVCQAVIRLPGFSPGADAEVDLARSLGVPVFGSLAEFMTWAHPAPPVVGCTFCGGRYGTHMDGCKSLV